MHFRYTLVELGLAALGEDWCRSRDDVQRLVHEWRYAFVFQRRQHDPFIPDRLLFDALAMVRCYTIFVGYRYQAMN